MAFSEGARQRETELGELADQLLLGSPGFGCGFRLGLVVRNLVVDHEPIYALGEWARFYEPVLLGLSAAEVGLLNDDRVGRALDRLFDTDRASLLTEIVLRAVRAFASATDATRYVRKAGCSPTRLPRIRSAIRRSVIEWCRIQVGVDQFI